MLPQILQQGSALVLFLEWLVLVGSRLLHQLVGFLHFALEFSVQPDGELGSCLEIGLFAIFRESVVLDTVNSLPQEALVVIHNLN